MDDRECALVKKIVSVDLIRRTVCQGYNMENDLFNILQSEVEIAKCKKYQAKLIEQTIDDLATDGLPDYTQMISRARELNHSSLYFFDLKIDEFEYFKTAVIRVLEERQLGYFKIEPEK